MANQEMLDTNMLVVTPEAHPFTALQAYTRTQLFKTVQRLAQRRGFNIQVPFVNTITAKDSQSVAGVVLYGGDIIE